LVDGIEDGVGRDNAVNGSEVDGFDLNGSRGFGFGCFFVFALEQPVENRATRRASRRTRLIAASPLMDSVRELFIRVFL